MVDLNFKPSSCSSHSLQIFPLSYWNLFIKMLKHRTNYFFKCFKRNFKRIESGQRIPLLLHFLDHQTISLRCPLEGIKVQLIFFLSGSRSRGTEMLLKSFYL